MGNRRGNTLIEFTLLGIPMIFIMVSVVSVSIDMWQFLDLPYCVEETARYVTTHGQGCSQNGSNCLITVGNVAAFFESQTAALDPSQVNVTLTDGSGSTNCNPVSACGASSAQFPNAGYNSPGSDVKVQATYVLKNPIAMFWPPDKDGSHDFTVGATSRQRIMF